MQPTMLAAKPIAAYLDKIAAALSSTERFSSKSKGGYKPSSSSSLGSQSRNNLQSTLHEARRNADVQPLNKNINKPRDLPSGRIKSMKNNSLSHMKDRRLLNQNSRAKVPAVKRRKFSSSLF